MFLNKSFYLGWNAESIQFKDVAADRTFWGEINDNKDGNNDNIFREYIRKTPWSARSTYYDLQRWGKMTISYVQSIVLLLWKLISTTIKNQTENEKKGQNKKKRKEKIKISSIQGKGPQTLLSGGHACFFFGASTSRFAPTVVSHSVDLYLDRTIRTKSV